MECEGHDGHATFLVFLQNPKMWMLVCDRHENEIARQEGEEFLEEFSLPLDGFSLDALLHFLKKHEADWEARYSKLLGVAYPKKEKPNAT